MMSLLLCPALTSHLALYWLSMSLMCKFNQGRGGVISSDNKSNFTIFHLSLHSGYEICSPPPGEIPLTGEITSPGYPSLYDDDLNCSISLEADTRIRLQFTDFDLREGGDYVMVVDQDGIETVRSDHCIQFNVFDCRVQSGYMDDCDVNENIL